MDMQHPGPAAEAAPAPVAPRRALVLSGGIALGAFEAGAYAGYEALEGGPPPWVLGASIGALNAAIIVERPIAARQRCAIGRAVRQAPKPFDHAIQRSSGGRPKAKR